MTRVDCKKLMCWLREMTFTDMADDGIGRIKLVFKVRDDDEFMRRACGEFSADDAKRLAVHFIKSVTFPCEDFEDDFDDPDLAPTYDFEDGAIIVDATFRN